MNIEDLQHLREREKELHCIYRVIQILKQEELTTDDILKKVVREIPSGWRYPGICMASIDFEGQRFSTPHFYPTQWYQSAEIIVDEKVLGEIRVYYSKNITGQHTLFLPEEQHLLNTLAEQISVFVFNRRVRRTLDLLGENPVQDMENQVLPVVSDKHWKWRLKMARLIAEQMDFKQLGVKAVYLIGSTKEAKAGPASDLDLVVHFAGDQQQESNLRHWIDGWSRSLAQINYEMTGYSMKQGMIDLHLVTDQELKNQSDSFAAMIGSKGDGAWLMRER
jgi:hypothetical protein